MRRSKLLLVLSILGLLIAIAMLFISAYMFDTKNPYESISRLIAFLGTCLFLVSVPGVVASVSEVFL